MRSCTKIWDIIEITTDIYRYDSRMRLSELIAYRMALDQ